MFTAATARAGPAGFSFSSPYRVRIWRNGHEAIFLVRQGATDPIDPMLEREADGVDGHGTETTGVETRGILMSAEQARAALSTRFLTDPVFEVSVDGVRVTFVDIPTHGRTVPPSTGRQCPIDA